MNSAFIHAINPTKVAVRGIIFALIVFLITPAFVTIDLDAWPFFYIFLAYTSLFFGFFSVPIRKKHATTEYNLTELQKNRVLYILIIISLIGVTLRLYERIFIRGIVVGADIFDNRDSLENSHTTITSVLATLLYPVVYFNLFWYYYCKKQNKMLYVFILVLFFFPVIDSYLIGSRSMVLQNIVVFGLIMRTFKQIKITLKIIIITIGSAIGVIALFALILYNRLGGDNFNFDFTLFATLSDYNFTYAVKPEYLESIDTSSNMIALLKYMYVNTGQYINHGIFEFNYLLTNYNVENLHAWGNNNLFMYKRFINLISGSQFVVSYLWVRPGVYTTFFGDVFVDFGWWGLLFMYILGLIIKKIYVGILKGNPFLIPMYFAFIYIIFLMPVGNLLSGGNGLIIVNSLFIPYIVFKLVKKSSADKKLVTNNFES